MRERKVEKLIVEKRGRKREEEKKRRKKRERKRERKSESARRAKERVDPIYRLYNLFSPLYIDYI